MLGQRLSPAASFHEDICNGAEFLPVASELPWVPAGSQGTSQVTGPAEPTALTHLPSCVLLVGMTLGECRGARGFMTLMKRMQSLWGVLAVLIAHRECLII